MSTEAMDWALEKAPPMPAQLVATLSGLARHADKKGRGTYPSVARLAAYTCKAERSVQRDLKQLRELGFIRLGDQSKAAHLPEGKRPEVYDLAMEREIPGGRAGSDEVTRTSRVTLASSRRRGGKKKPSTEGASSGLTGDVDVRGDAHVTGDVGVADGVTSTSRRGDAHVTQTKKMNQQPEPKDSYGALNSPRAAGVDEERDYAWRTFAEFWVCYPRPMKPEKTKQAWRDALDRGADPDHIAKAAKAYAYARRNEDQQFTPYSNTWLDAGSYDDPIDAQQPSDGPHRNPADASDYHQGWD